MNKFGCALIVASILSVNVYGESGDDKDLLKGMDPVSRIKVLKQFDKDGDGILSAEEKADLRKAIDEKVITVENDKESKIRDIFSRYDLDKDGKLDEKEFGVYFEAQKKLFESENKARSDRKGFRKQILSKYDKEGKGYLNEQEKAEVAKDMQKMYTDALKKYDKEGKGYLSPADMEKARKEMSNFMSK